MLKGFTPIIEDGWNFEAYSNCNCGCKGSCRNNDEGKQPGGIIVPLYSLYCDPGTGPHKAVQDED